MSVRCRFRGLFKKNMAKAPKIVEICTTVPVSYLFIPVKLNQLEKANVSADAVLEVSSKKTWQKRPKIVEICTTVPV